MCAFFSIPVSITLTHYITPSITIAHDITSSVLLSSITSTYTIRHEEVTSYIIPSRDAALVITAVCPSNFCANCHVSFTFLTEMTGYETFLEIVEHCWISLEFYNIAGYRKISF